MKKIKATPVELYHFLKSRFSELDTVLDQWPKMTKRQRKKYIKYVKKMTRWLERVYKDLSKQLEREKK